MKKNILFKSRLQYCLMFTLSFLLFVGLQAQTDWSNYSYMGSLNGHSYYLSNANIYANWIPARTAAEAQGGYLASITTAQENTFLTSYGGYGTGKSRGPLIGLSDLDRDGIFVWHSGESVVYSNWVPGEPSGGIPTTAEYVQFQSFNSGRWNDLGDFWGPYAYIVEIEDVDNDGTADAFDNCISSANADQADLDGDGIGDVCDLCNGADASGDTDGDGICDDLDTDDDGDGCLDGVDANPLVVGVDTDGDGVSDDCDNCAGFANSNQDDLDGDGKGDKCDLCRMDAIEADNNGNGTPDCQECGNGNGNNVKVKVTLVIGDVCNPSNEKEKCISVSALDSWLSGGNGNGGRYQGAPRLALCPLRKGLNSGSSMTIMPNPVAHKLVLNLEQFTIGQANLFIYDLSGKVVEFQQKEILNKQQTIKLDVSSLANGVYYISIQIGKEHISEKFVKLTN